MKFVLVAGDHAQSLVLKELGDKLEKAGHQVRNFLGYGKKDAFPLDEMTASLDSVDWLVAGMSELSDAEVLAVTEAQKLNVKIALYADTFGIPHRLEQFHFMKHMEFTLFILNDNEATIAYDVFPHVVTKVTGNPRWEAFAFPRFSREEARQKLDASPAEKVIFSVADKFLAMNIVQFSATIDAVHKLGWGKNTRLFFPLHPGGDPEHIKLYDEVVENSGLNARIIGKHVGIPTPDVLPGCDLLINFTSTVAVEAACLRIPVIDFCTTIALRGEIPLMKVSPSELTKQGAATPVYYGSTDALAERMREINENNLLARFLREAQERMFPVPPADSRGQALRLMCQALGA